MLLRAFASGCLIALLALGVGEARAEALRRVALVIGNGAYARVANLPNASRDAQAIEELFKTSGFDVVRRAGDLGGAALRKALREFSDDAATADVAVVFYAGHGIEVGGTNYLVPVDAALARDTDVEDEAVSLDRVSQLMERARRLRLVILDACRENPFAASMKSTSATRSIGRGLARVEVRTGDTLIAYAAKAGSLAADGSGSNSPYTSALLKHLATPGLDVQFALRRVRDEVLKSTQGKQEPFVYGSLGGTEIALVPGVATGQTDAATEAASAWAWIKDTTDRALVENFLQRFPTSEFAGAARARLAAISKQSFAAASPTKATPALGSMPTAASPSPAMAAAPPAAVPAPPPATQVASADTRPAPSATRDPIAALVPGSGQRARDRLADGSDCSFCPEMVVVPAGGFMMGSNTYESEKLHRVTIAKAFAVGRFEVTFAEWDACVADRGCNHKPDDKGWGRGRQPVIHVSWEDITTEYLPWLSRKTGKTYRLLSEAEWEYAARAGTTTSYFWGNAYSDDKANRNRERSVDVGRYLANAWGLHDMHGNVDEWVQDCYHDSYRSAPTNGVPWMTACTDERRRMVRGGSWYSLSENLRSASRDRFISYGQVHFIGFRVSRTLAP